MYLVLSAINVIHINSCFMFSKDVRHEHAYEVSYYLVEIKFKPSFLQLGRMGFWQVRNKNLLSGEINFIL